MADGMPLKIALIVGCARSGTTILGELIAAHPEVNYIYEAHEVWEIGGMGSNESHRLTERHATPEVIGSIREWFTARNDGRTIVEKCPRNALRIPYLRAIFPEARFIHIVRDGRDVTCSLRPGIGGAEWRHLKPENWRELQTLPAAARCAMTWREVVTVAERDLAGVEHLKVIYEDLVAKPERVAAAILEFLGLPPSDQVLEFCRRVQNSTDGSYVPERDSRQWNTEDHERRIGRWRENLTAGEQAEIEKLLGPTLRSLGYAA